MKVFFNSLFLICLLFILSNCIKPKKNIPPDIICKNAQACVGNSTIDTIFYSWNSEQLTDTLLPGKITCLGVGDIHCIFNKKTGAKSDQSFKTITINSTFGEWAMNVETCNKRSNFEYDHQHPSDSLILLYAQ